MSETLIRQWQMLRLIPRAPRKISSAGLEAALRDEGFEVNRRTIQRDLQHLAGVFPLIVDDQHVPYGWSWVRDAAALDVPGMDLHTALAFRLAAEHLERLLPAPARQALEPHFEAASQRLNALEGNAMRAWPEKARVVQAGPSRVPPKVNPEVLEAVQSALFHEKRLRVSYQARGSEDATRFEVNPLGIVCRDDVTYLVCTIWRYEDVRQLCLHRMRRPRVRDKAAVVPEGFSLEAYVRSEAFGFLLSEEVVRLEARFSPDVAASLLESPIGENQVVGVEEDGWVRIEADVGDTMALRTWLLGYGATVEVVGPGWLREEMGDEVVEMRQVYGL
jgi:predicted DNA-binding transcriptional regulator YafY